jgi:hypothetical protein
MLLMCFFSESKRYLWNWSAKMAVLSHWELEDIGYGCV